MKKQKKETKEQKYKKALEKIASARELKHELRDYHNIGKNAIHTAVEALYEPCERCGK